MKSAAYAKRLAEFKKSMVIISCPDEKRVIEGLKYILSLPKREKEDKSEAG